MSTRLQFRAGLYSVQLLFFSSDVHYRVLECLSVVLWCISVVKWLLSVSKIMFLLHGWRIWRTTVHRGMWTTIMPLRTSWRDTLLCADHAWHIEGCRRLILPLGRYIRASKTVIDFNEALQTFVKERGKRRKEFPCIHDGRAVEQGSRI
ncbi:unnamed protein product [Acanthoscelides obtectus]|uniref:Uncharacterized protein n=1 Tax=Acanthoscelides obtectus TaxID=200917 RepID=A0A9P0PIJ1_ACAOB|nr:unnamed protein product [Acanthoscelides obtectus]CAK1637848.1 hypothetical protein AOBTE_LOCUS10228 [Acanthoscelides obtectus]